MDSYDKLAVGMLVTLVCAIGFLLYSSAVNPKPPLPDCREGYVQMHGKCIPGYTP